MYSKSSVIATGLLVTLLAAACVSLPWSDEPVGQEVNLIVVMKNNLLFLPSATIDGRSGRFLFGSAEQRTVIDAKFAPASAPHKLELTEKESLKITSVPADLHGIGDAIVGADVFRNHAVTIDYVSGLLTYQKEGMHPELMTVYKFDAEPMVNVLINGQPIAAIVDTASPDTLILPGAAKNTRRAVHVEIAGTDFGNVDVLYAPVAKPRLGNRLLSKFLVTIDYGKKRVGLWRDPRS